MSSLGDYIERRALFSLWKIMINISWIRWHIYNFVVCKYNDNKQSESELSLMQDRY